LPADLTPLGQPELAEPDAAEELVVDAANDTLKAIAASLSIFCLLVVTPIVTLYLLNDWDGLIATIDRSVPMAQRETVRTLSREIDDTLAGFLRGQDIVPVIEDDTKVVTRPIECGLNSDSKESCLPAGFWQLSSSTDGMTSPCVTARLDTAERWRASVSASANSLRSPASGRLLMAFPSWFNRHPPDDDLVKV
jgi:hypothetical protein